MVVLLNLDLLLLRSSVYTFQQSYLNIERVFFYHNWGCKPINPPLSYPLRSLTNCIADMNHCLKHIPAFICDNFRNIRKYVGIHIQRRKPLKIKIIDLQPLWVTKVVIILSFFLFNIRGRLSMIRCDDLLINHTPPSTHP